jgi:WD40 repeat protein
VRFAHPQGVTPAFLITRSDDIKPDWGHNLPGSGHPNPVSIHWAEDAKSLRAVLAPPLREAIPQEFHWEPASGQLLSISDVRPQRSPDGKRLVECLELRDAETKAVISKLDVPEGQEPLRLAWSFDGAMVAACRTSADIRLFDAGRGKLIKKLSDPQGGPWRHGLAFSPDAKTVACASSARRIALLDVESGQIRSEVDGGFHITALAWSPDGKQFAVGTHSGNQPGDHEYGGRVDVWTGDGKRRLFSREADFPLNCLTWTPDSKTLAVGFYDAIRLYGADSGELVATLVGTGIQGWPPTMQQSLWVTPSGHHRAEKSLEHHLVYVVQLDDGRQQTLPPEEFARRYGWKNDPERVGLSGK